MLSKGVCAYVESPQKVYSWWYSSTCQGLYSEECTYPGSRSASFVLVACTGAGFRQFVDGIPEFILLKRSRRTLKCNPREKKSIKNSKDIRQESYDSIQKTYFSRSSQSRSFSVTFSGFYFTESCETVDFSWMSGREVFLFAIRLRRTSSLICSRLSRKNCSTSER